jgi:transcriptional regulator with XRE-family HTH domain
MSSSNENRLGRYLKDAREEKKLSLRAVEALTGISNAYLSQIESGKIRQPSPVWLHKLSGVYGVSYGTVMRLAGYPVPMASEDTESYAGLAERLGPISKSEENAVAEYLEFLRARRLGRRKR